MRLILPGCPGENARMGEKQPQGAKQLAIKKYANRRYYDSLQSRHLTLDEIRKLIQQGYDLRVTDAASGVDITIRVLAQIILDLDPRKLDSFPAPLLIQLIQSNEQSAKDLIAKHFSVVPQQNREQAEGDSVRPAAMPDSKPDSNKQGQEPAAASVSPNDDLSELLRALQSGQ